MKYIMEWQFDLRGPDESRLLWDAFGTGLWKENLG